MNKAIMLIINIFFYTSAIITEAQPSGIINQPSSQEQYVTLQKKLSPLIQAWHPIIPQREKYTISPGGIIGRLLLGGIMAGPALTLNYINQYLTKEQYKGEINTLTLLVAAASAAPAIRNLIGTTGMAFYDALTYPDIEAIKAKNKTVEEKIYIINSSLTSLELKLPSNFIDFVGQTQVYEDIKKLFKTPRTYLDILTFKNKQKDDIRQILEKYKNYNTKEKLRLVLERRKAMLISTIYQLENLKTSPSSSSFLDWNNPGQAIVFGILALPWMIIDNIASSYSDENKQRKQTIIDLNKEISLIDTILAALATYP